MSDPSHCPHCGKPMPASALGGLCPECMLKVGVATQTDEEAADRIRPTRSPPPPPPAPEEIARHFPQLEILECLGRGGMGVVYKARQQTLNRLVALKVLAPEKGADPKFAERFSREAQALARLNHPNIVTVHDFGVADGLFYLLMEFVDGVSLRQLLQEKRMTPEEALVIVPRICEALQYAHEQGIVHRDIKPENVLLDKAGRVKIADFGIAKILGEERPAQALTEDRQIVGTPHYMAPEQVEQPLLVDHRADIYSLGVVFYEMLTGELPLGRFQPPSRKVQIDVRLDQVVLHALEKEPERRYQRASEVKTDLDTISANAVKSEVRDPRSEVHGEAEGAALPEPVRVPPGPDEERRKKLLRYGILACVIGLPVGLMLNLPFVWILSLVGIAVGAFKLGLLRNLHTRFGTPNAAVATDPTAGSAKDLLPGVGGSAFDLPLNRAPRILWVPMLVLVLCGIWKGLVFPGDATAAAANVLLALGLLYRFKLAYVAVLFFAIMSVLMAAFTSNPVFAFGILVLNTLVAGPVLLCTDWFFPRDPVTGRRANADWVTGTLFALPAVLFLLFLRGGHVLLGLDLDPDAQLILGIVGLPFSAALGALLAVTIRGSSKDLAFDGAGKERPPFKGWSWWAIAAVGLLVLSLPLGGGLSAIQQLISQEPGWNPSADEAWFTFTLGALAAVTILGSVVLGAEALRQMRVDPSRSRGRRGALAATWLWPSLLATVFLAPVQVTTASATERQRLAAQEERRRLADTMEALVHEAPATRADRSTVTSDPGAEPPLPVGFAEDAVTARASDVIRVAADGSGAYATIQAAIDAAPDGALIHIGRGRYDERLAISMPLSLTGDGWEETVIGPEDAWTPPSQEEMQSLEQQFRAASSEAERQKLRQQAAEQSLPPVLKIRGTTNVRLSGLKFVFPGLGPEGKLLPATVLDLRASQVAIENCAVIGSPGSGVVIGEGATVTLSNLLVAAAWNTGIVVERGGMPSHVLITDSDIRNCHYAGITLGRGQSDVRIERCRISGAAWHGVRYDDAAPTVLDSLIFANARCGIYASGKTAALVQGNIFWKNEMNGMSCWFENRDRIENNTFAANLREGLSILGASEPVLERNIFWGNPQGIALSAIQGDSATARIGGNLQLRDNLFWTNGVNLAMSTGKEAGGKPLIASLALEAFPGCREAEPGFVDPGRGDFAAPPDSIAVKNSLGASGAPAVASPWPLQPEEKAIIPDGDTRDSRQWKRAVSP